MVLGIRHAFQIKVLRVEILTVILLSLLLIEFAERLVRWLVLHCVGLHCRLEARLLHCLVMHTFKRCHIPIGYWLYRLTDLIALVLSRINVLGIFIGCRATWSKSTIGEARMAS